MMLQGLSILLLFLLFGCAPSTQELIEQAHLTDDWSFVNKRFEAIERREEQHPSLCPHGTRPWCSKRLSDEKCSCIKDSDFRDNLRLMGL